MTDFAGRYATLAHAVQTGVAQFVALDEQSYDGGGMSATQMGHSPKMLRTGVNMALVEQSAVARLLMEKGVFTEEEYQAHLLRALEEEVARYEEELSQRMGGVKITLA